MAEAAALAGVSAVVSLLLSPKWDKLVSKVKAALGMSKADEKLRRELEKELKFLDIRVKFVGKYVEDAERKQLKNDDVGAWLQMLKDVAYDAEDLLDGYVTDVALLHIKEEEEEKKTIKDKVLNYVSSSRDSAVPNKIDYKSLLDKIKAINESFKRLADMKDDLRLDKLDSHMQFYQRDAGGRESQSLPDPKVVGRDDVKKQIVDLLKWNEAEHSSSSKELRVLPVVGMGGVGKTTLAQLVFHDDDVKKHFNLKIWVWVSQVFDHLEILKQIVQEVEGREYSSKLSLEKLYTKVRAGIENKIFLLVLDDAWSEDRNQWDQVFDSLRHGHNGSCSVIVTTRSLKVADSIEGRLEPIRLKGLDDECIWRVLEYCAFGGPADPNKHLDLVKIGKDIAKELKGSPLAARAMGRVLNKGLSIDRWNGILRSELWHSDGRDEHGNTILPSLMLSYQHLSPDLR